jgi:RNA polymerase sigma factor (sigma-70 family)
MFGAATIDDEIVGRAADGHQGAMARVVDAVQPQIRLMVAARLSPTPSQLADVDDIVQEVEMALTAGFTRLEKRSVDGLRAFLSAIVTNKVAVFLRHTTKQCRAVRGARSLDTTIGTLSNAGPLWQFLSSSGTSPLTAADRADKAARLIAELGRLRADHREIITLAFFDQLGAGEIGERLGLSRQAASMNLLRAVRNLRLSMANGAEQKSECGVHV